MNLKEFRAKTGLSLTQFAERTGLNRSAISDAERGKATVGAKIGAAIQRSFRCVVTFKLDGSAIEFLDEAEWVANQPSIEEMFRNADVQSPDA